MIHPAIRDLFLELNRHPEFQKLLRQLTPGHPVTVSLSGLTNTAKAIYLVLLWQAVGKPLLVVVDGSKQAESLSELIQTFFEVLVTDPATPRPLLIPALDVLPHQNLSPHPEISEQRVTGMWRLVEGLTSIVVTPVASALLCTDTAESYRQLALPL